MKKFLMILVLGLLWCNVGFAQIVEFKKCYPEKRFFDMHLEHKKGEYMEGSWKSWEEHVQDIGFLKDRIVTINTDAGTLSITILKENSTQNIIQHVYILQNYTSEIITAKRIEEDNDTYTEAIIYFDIKNASYNDDERVFIKSNNQPIMTAIFDFKCEPTSDTFVDQERGQEDNKIVPAASGTGFFVSRAGHIVSNHHVIEECKAVKVNYKGDEIEAKTIAVDKTNDLAILQAKIDPAKVYTVSNKDVSLLEDVIVAGFPLGKKVSAAIKTHKGSVSALAGFGDNYSNFQTDATINEGNSGGPVIDQKGNVVGVAVALMPVESGQNIFFAVKSSTLKTFANSNGLQFLPPNNRDLSNRDLGKLITDATVYLECWMTFAKIKELIAREENRKAFFSEFK